MTSHILRVSEGGRFWTTLSLLDYASALKFMHVRLGWARHRKAELHELLRPQFQHGIKTSAS
jgi:hypothetical protein